MLACSQSPSRPILPVSATTKEGQQHATPTNDTAVIPSQQTLVPLAKDKSQDTKSPLVTTRSGRVVKRGFSNKGHDQSYCVQCAMTLNN